MLSMYNVKAFEVEFRSCTNKCKDVDVVLIYSTEVTQSVEPLTSIEPYWADAPDVPHPYLHSFVCVPSVFQVIDSLYIESLSTVQADETKAYPLSTLVTTFNE